jgi:hypothetical protein
VALSWLLLMSLGLPMLDYGRSYRPLIDRMVPHIPRQACIATASVPRALQAALEYFGGYEVDGARPAEASGCVYRVQKEPAARPRPVPPGWTLVAREREPTDREEVVAIFKRAAAP